MVCRNSYHERGVLGPLTARKERLPDLAVKLVNQYFTGIIRDYDLQYVDSDASIWRRSDRSEPLDTDFKNRMLFSKFMMDVIGRSG